jgi:gliding motility-associated-like protein
LIVTNQYGSDTLTLYSYIRIESNPSAYVGPDTSMFFGNSYQLSAFGGLSYVWTADDTTGLSATNIPNPVASPPNTTTYTCSITDAAGCTAVRQVTVTILHNNNFFVPTAFSPNEDGRNDLLFLRGNNLRNVQFTVFDRWGEKVFETNDISIGWDGRYKGKQLNSGVFTWVATMMYDDANTVTESGTTTLIR